MIVVLVADLGFQTGFIFKPKPKDAKNNGAGNSKTKGKLGKDGLSASAAGSGQALDGEKNTSDSDGGEDKSALDPESENKQMVPGGSNKPGSNSNEANSEENGREEGKEEGGTPGEQTPQTPSKGKPKFKADITDPNTKKEKTKQFLAAFKTEAKVYKEELTKEVGGTNHIDGDSESGGGFAEVLKQFWKKSSDSRGGG